MKLIDPASELISPAPFGTAPPCYQIVTGDRCPKWRLPVAIVASTGDIVKIVGIAGAEAQLIN